MTLCTRAPRIAPDAHQSPARTAPGRRRRPRRQRMALILAVPLLALGLAACNPSPEQDAVRAHVNQSRQAQGVPAIGDDLTARLKAQAWAERLADAGSLSHSQLSAGLDALPWTAVAENVGRGPSIDQTHASYMASPRHRANILDRRWDRIGTGHAVGRDGLVYTVQVFVDLG